MIVVHVHHSFHPVKGGIENVVYNMALGQARQGHEVHVITTRLRGTKKYEVIEDLVHVHRLRSARLLYRDLSLPLERPREILERADIVHIHSQNSIFNMSIASKAKEKGVRVAVHFMAVDALRTHPSLLKRTIGSKLQAYLTRKAMELADIPIVKSMRDKELLKRYGVETVYLPDGISDEYFTAPRDPYTFRRKYGIDATDLYLYIGRLHPAKGPQVLVQAAAFLREKYDDFKAAFIGPGEVKWLRRLAVRLSVQDHVVFTGFIPESLKISAIDGSTAVIVPSLYDYVEVYSLTTSEALARGKPVIASRVGELPYRIADGHNGILVRAGDPKALAEAMLRVKRIKLKPYGRIYSWEEVLDSLSKIYAEYL